MRKLFRSKKDKKIFGVCGGLAEYFNMDVTIIRLITAFLVIFWGAGVLAYLVAALVMPVENDSE